MSSRTPVTALLSVLGIVGLSSTLLACSSDDTDGGASGPSGTASPNGTGSSGPSGTDDDDDGNVGEANGKTPTGECVIKYNITKNATWSPTSCPDGYLLKYSLEVRGDAELRLEPGTVVKVARNGGLTVTDNAAIIAKGQSSSKVVFDGATVSQASWSGLEIKSSNALNELSYVKIQHAGSHPDTFVAAINVSDNGVLALADVDVIDNGAVGLSLWGNGKYLRFDRVTIARNVGAPAQVTVPKVKYLKGLGTVITDNGANNSIIVEATSLHKITEDSVWPALPYRIAGQNGLGSGVVEVESHLEIEAGAILELTSGSGFLVEGGSSGLKVVGTPGQKVVFRGVDGSSWSGITYGESAWSGNRLEHVEIKNAAGAPSWGYYGTGNSGTPKAGILLGYNFTTPVAVVLKDFVISGPNSAPADVAVKGASTLGQEGNVVGTGAAGALAIQTL